MLKIEKQRFYVQYFFLANLLSYSIYLKTITFFTYNFKVCPIKIDFAFCKSAHMSDSF